MAMTGFEHHTPWTEAEWLALGETPDRVELFDGSLLVTPAPTAGHQTISRRLANALEPAAERAGLEVYEAINLRLKTDRVPIPDLVLARPVDPTTLVFDAVNVPLVSEITSPSNSGTDKILKMHYYAEAGIPWYLLVDPDPLKLRLFRLDGDHYVDHAEAKAGTVLNLTEPVVVDIDPASLLPRRPKD